MDDDDPAADRADFGKDVRTEYQGMLAAKLLYESAGLNYLYRVDADRWLIHDQDVRLMENRLRDADSLPKSLRQLLDVGVAVVPELDDVYDGREPLIDPCPVHTAHLAHEPEIVGHFHVQVERHGFRQVADMAARLERVRDHVVAGNGHGPFRRGRVAGHDPHGRRLAGAVRPQKPDDLSLFNVERDIDYGRV